MAFYKEQIINDIALDAGQSTVVTMTITNDCTISRIFVGPTEVHHTPEYSLSIFNKESVAENPLSLVINTEDRSVSGSGNLGYNHPNIYEVITPIDSTGGIIRYRADAGPKSGYPFYSHETLEGSDPSAKSRSRKIYIRLTNNSADSTMLSLVIGYWYGD